MRSSAGPVPEPAPDQGADGAYMIVFKVLFSLACLAVFVWGMTIFYENHVGRLIRKSQEAATRGRLAELRKAPFPPAEVPLAQTPKHHRDSRAIRRAGASDDAGGWLYDAGQPRVSVNCTHTDSHGSVWNAY